MLSPARIFSVAPVSVFALILGALVLWPLAPWKFIVPLLVSFSPLAALIDLPFLIETNILALRTVSIVFGLLLELGSGLNDRLVVGWVVHYSVGTGWLLGDVVHSDVWVQSLLFLLILPCILAEVIV